MRSGRRRLDRNVIALGGAAFLQDASSEMIFPFLPAFLTTVLGAPPLFLGVIEGAADSLSSLLRPVFGSLSDRSGRRKPFVVAGYAIANATRPVLAIVAAPWQVLAVRLCDRLGKAIRTAPRDALLADSSDADDRGRAFGFHRAMDHAGAVVGPLIASLVFVAVGRSYRWLFLLASIPGVLTVLFAAFRVREIVPAARTEAPVGVTADGETSTVSSLFENRSFLILLVAILLFTLGNSSDAFLLLRLGESGVDVAWLPALWAALHVVKTVSVYPCGILSDRFGRRPMLLVGWAFYALVYAGFAILSEPAAIAALFVGYGLFYGLTEGAERALIADLVEPGRRGAAFGIYNGALGIAALPASLLTGAIWQLAGSGPAFLCGAGFAAIAALVLFRVGSSAKR